MDLAGRRILVVEDDANLAASLCAALRERGATVLGPAPTPFYAMSLIGRRGVDGAVLDIRLHGTTVFEVADELTSRGTPLVFATPYGPEMVPSRHRHQPVVTKPFDEKSIGTLVKHLSGQTHAPVTVITPIPSVVAEGEGDMRRDKLMRIVAKSLSLGVPA